MIWFVIGLITGFTMGVFLSDMTHEDKEEKDG